MNQYVALLRGIGPGAENMRNKRLREVFEKLGFSSVQTVISSGNVLFKSPDADKKTLETLVEKALATELGLQSTTIIRSKAELEQLVAQEPFAGLTHSASSYLMVTFLKEPAKASFNAPYQPPSKPYKVIGLTSTEVFTVTDNTVIKTTDLMTWLEKHFGKQITSRTWLTVHRINKKLNQTP